jgi:hypothetical protein
LGGKHGKLSLRVAHGLDIGEMNAMLTSSDFERFGALLDDEVRFYGMLSERPSVGRDGVVGVFRMLAAICDDVEYVEEFASAAGVVLLSRGRIRGQSYEALQVVRFGVDGRIVEFHDSLRPLPALEALRAAAADWIAARRVSSG